MLEPKFYTRFFVAGVVCLANGLFINYALPPIISLYIDTQISLTPNSQSYPMWKDIPVPVYQKFYFFNVTNAQDIEQRGHKPILEEIGPFTYRSDWTKRDIEHDESGNKINFKQYKQWQFVPEMSIADHRIQLVTLNAPLAITLTLIQSASSAVRLLVTFSLDGLSEGFFTKRSVKQLLFDGYPDLLTTFGPILNAEMLSQGGHFGYMNARNNSLDGEYEINTGADDITKLNTINKYNGLSELPYWSGTCNSLENSTTGEMFPPVMNETSIKLFQPDFCRVWPLDYTSDIQAAGLDLKRFVATRDVFKSHTCYKPARHHNDLKPQRTRNRNHNRVRHDWPNGVFTLAPCKFNAPIYMSMPHFLDADPHFLAQIDGLKPDPDKHEFFIDLEPRTGSPVVLSARVQLNVAISKPQGLVRFRNVPEIMFPVFWQELSVNLTNNKPVIDQLVLASRGALEATIQIAYSFLLLGGAILITVGLFYIHWRLHTADTSNTTTDDGSLRKE